MFDAFPYDEWSETVTDFWTFGGANSTGTYIMTALGVILMVASIVGWVWMENTKLQRQAAILRASAPATAPRARLPCVAKGYRYERRTEEAPTSCQRSDAPFVHAWEADTAVTTRRRSPGLPAKGLEGPRCGLHYWRSAQLFARAEMLCHTSRSPSRGAVRWRSLRRPATDLSRSLTSSHQ